MENNDKRTLFEGNEILSPKEKYFKWILWIWKKLNEFEFLTCLGLNKFLLEK